MRPFTDRRRPLIDGRNYVRRGQFRAPLLMTASNPPTQYEVQASTSKINELLPALQRESE
jgi:hypothetical protein